MSKLIIGLTGGIGSGKTTVTNAFAKLGVDIIDADIIAREVVALERPALKSIAQHFGKNFLLADGQLNRKLLRQKVFSDEASKQWLNSLLHPLIRTAIINQTKEATSPYCILVAPLLIENQLLKLVDRVLVIDVLEQTQITRTMQRDGNTEEQVKSVMASQIPRNKRLAAADDIIDNDSTTFTEIENLVAKLDKKYLTLTKMH